MVGSSTSNSVTLLISRIKIAKIPLCLLVAFSSVFGFFYATPDLSLDALYVFIAVFLLACGAATLNSYQERIHDGLMQRTKDRPLVQETISQKNALIQAIILIVSGLTILLLLSNIYSFLAGLAAWILYNFVYTQLKSKSIYAIVPGAICGAIPPYIGWLATGQEAFSFQAVLPVLLLIFWQIPHFLLVLLNYKSDYLESTFPNLLKRVSEASVQRIFLPWISALVVTMLTFTVVPSTIGTIGRFMIVCNAIILFITFCVQLIYRKKPNYSFLFLHLNISIFIIMLVICSAAITF